MARRKKTDGPRELRHYSYGLTQSRPLVARIGPPREAGVVQWDMHYEIELGLLTRGKMERYWPDHHRTCQRGDVWLSGTWEPHGRVSPSLSAESIVFFVLPQWLSALQIPSLERVDWLGLFSAPPASRPAPSPKQRSELLALVLRFRTHIPRVYLAFDPWLIPMFMEILLLIYSFHEPLKRNHPHPDPGVPDSVNPAVQLAFESDRLVPVREAAEACAMSVRNFERVFKRLMGVSFAQFALRRRIAGAAHDLASTREPIKALAANWGFSDVSHLHHLFVRHYGCTPLEHRRQRGKPRGS